METSLHRRLIAGGPKRPLSCSASEGLASVVPMASERPPSSARARNILVSVETAQREIASHQQQIARLQQDKGREAKRAAEASKKAGEAARAASKTSNLSTRQSKGRDAQRYSQDAAKHQQKVADIEGKIASEQRRLNAAQTKLVSEQKSAQRRQDVAHAQAARESERRVAQLSREHSRLDEKVQSAMDRLQSLPEQITVLFLAANPRDQPLLSLDEEVRSIGEMIRKSLHRDAVRLESRWALRPHDVLQALNEVRPRIIHFSGHGAATGELILQDDHGGSKLVTKEAMVQVMAVLGDGVELVFFNTCFSQAQAQRVTEHVPAAIGMSDTIGDEAARVFSSQFYSAIGFGRSVLNAFGQAKAALMLEGIPEEATPELYLRDGVDGDELGLVRPGLAP